MYTNYEVFIIFLNCETVDEVMHASKLLGILVRNGCQPNPDMITKLSCERIKALA